MDLIETRKPTREYDYSGREFGGGGGGEGKKGPRMGHR